MRGNSDHPELVLPCFDRLLQAMKRKVQILYQFRRSGMSNPAHQDSVPLSVEGEDGRSCQNDYISASNIDRTIHSIPRQRSDLGSEKTLVKDLDPMVCYNQTMILTYHNDILLLPMSTFVSHVTTRYKLVRLNVSLCIWFRGDPI